MRQIVGIQQRHHDRHCNTVIAAQGGPFGIDHIAVNGEIQSLMRHVLVAVRRLFAHHIHVALQNNALRVFIAGGGILADDDIVQCILPIGQTPRLGK